MGANRATEERHSVRKHKGPGRISMRFWPTSRIWLKFFLRTPGCERTLLPKFQLSNCKMCRFNRKNVEKSTIFQIAISRSRFKLGSPTKNFSKGYYPSFQAITEKNFFSFFKCKKAQNFTMLGLFLKLNLERHLPNFNHGWPWHPRTTHRSFIPIAFVLFELEFFKAPLPGGKDGKKQE